jgi:hypothetical protein
VYDPAIARSNLEREVLQHSMLIQVYGGASELDEPLP